MATRSLRAREVLRIDKAAVAAQVPAGHSRINHPAIACALDSTRSVLVNGSRIVETMPIELNTATLGEAMRSGANAARQRARWQVAETDARYLTLWAQCSRTRTQPTDLVFVGS